MATTTVIVGAPRRLWDPVFRLFVDEVRIDAAASGNVARLPPDSGFLCLDHDRTGS